jgi:ATP-dependent protease ClpP protease subunit
MNPGWAFGMRGASTEVLEIDIYDDIGESSWWGETVSAKDVKTALKGSKASTIKLRVNSRGGEVFEGFAIYNLLKDHPARVEAQVDALAASMASIVIMAADEIKIAKNALIMVHNPWSFAMGEADDLRQTADLLDKMRDASADVYAARTGVTKERAIEMMDAETWLTAEEAKAEGFADVIIPDKRNEAHAKLLAGLRFDGLIAPPRALIAACAQARNAAPNVSKGAEPVQEQNSMKEEQRIALCLALGVSADTAPEAMAQRAAALVAAQGKAPEGFELTPKGELASAQARAVAAEAEVATSRKATREAAVNACLDGAVKDGKIVPASREKYAALCATDAGFETVRELVATLPTSALLGVQGKDGAPASSEGGKRTKLTADEVAHCKKHNLDEALYLQSINEER